MNNPPMNSAINNSHVLSEQTQKKKKAPKPKATNGTTTAGAGAKKGRKKKIGDDKKAVKKKFGKKGVTVTSQAREIVYNVIKHFKKEASQKCNSHPFENWLKRSVAATGLSKSTLQRIIKEVEKPAIKVTTEHVAMPSKDHQPHHPPIPQQPPSGHPNEILVNQTLEAVKLEQYEQGLIKHFTSNFMHHNIHHHPMTPHHPDLLIQPIHHTHSPMPPPPQPPPPPIHSHSHPHIHL